MNDALPPTSPASVLYWVAALAQRSAAILLGLVFFIAGLMKAITLSSFAESASTLLTVSDAVGWPLAILLVAVEVVIGLALILNRRPAEAAVAAASLILFFTAITLRADALGIIAACNCFGAVGLNFSLVQHLLLDGFLFALAAVVTVPSPKRR